MSRVIALAFLCVALIAAGCGGDDGEAPQATETASLTPLSTVVPSPTVVDASPTNAPLAPTGTPMVIAPTQAPSTGAAQVMRRGTTDRYQVVLTFDAGADAGFTSQILDTLGANGITAAFGITGRWAEQNPQLLQRIVRDGHQLINHSYSHPSFTGYSTGAPPLTQVQRWDQLDRTEAIVRDLTGASTLPYFRPPYGDYDDGINADVGARGYAYNVMWTIDSMGWNGLGADGIVQRCLAQAVPGAIYVFHVGSASRDAAALQRVIDGLRNAGYALVPLSAFAQ
jgi:peptidoglycan/xylan/chitin deacetylase (PgdA/CDA1 family)